MNANAIAKHYGRLKPEERFRLILAAGARGDEAEQDRLAAAGQRLTLSMYDHEPFGHAFDEVALSTFLELLEAAADYLDALTWADEEEYLDETGKEPDGPSTWRWRRATCSRPRPPAGHCSVSA
jgi:hypothetical protein